MSFSIREARTYITCIHTLVSEDSQASKLFETSKMVTMEEEKEEKKKILCL